MRAAAAAGYADHGAPGERAMYHPGYYGAFVRDPDGHNIEVVNHNRDPPYRRCALRARGAVRTGRLAAPADARWPHG